MPILIGLISDTHGLLRPEATRAMAGVDVILHAGDVGGRDVIEALARIAPIEAVMGNTDPPALGLRDNVVRTWEGVSVHVSHGDELGRPTPERLLARYAQRVLVYGHTHRALVHRAGDRLVINPGAAGPRRFDLHPSVARLTIESGKADVEIVWLTR